VTTAAGVSGHRPNTLIAPAPKRDREAEKYAEMWSIDDYRKFSPGENIAHTFLEVAKIPRGAEVIDFGTGTGRGALMLAVLGGATVTMVDFAENCLDEDVRNAVTNQNGVLRFVKADLRKEIPVNAKYGFCTDVMEHIPPEEVNQTLVNILRSAQHVFFQISLVDDAFGANIGAPLHLTVQPYEWWYAKLLQLDAVINWSRNDGNSALFYVTAWNTASDLVARGCLNTEQKEIDDNIRASIKRGLKQCLPHNKQDRTVLLLAGGPSLNDFTDEIKAKRAAGAALVTLNGTYNWALNNGLAPSAQIIVDAQEHNKRFVSPTHKDCKYLLASQCHPAVFDATPAGQTYLWHSAVGHMSDELTEFYSKTNDVWHPTPGGSTVALRAFTLLRMLGFHRFEVYGLDSCVTPDEHHAYAQAENDKDGNKDRLITVECGGRTFKCTPWMASQAQEFIDLTKLVGEEIDLVVHGPGLIAHIIQTAADMDDITVIE